MLLLGGLLKGSVVVWPCGTIMGASTCPTPSSRLAFSTSQSSPAFVRAPEEMAAPSASSARSRRTCSGVGPFDTVEEDSQRCSTFGKLPDATWLIERHGFRHRACEKPFQSHAPRSIDPVSHNRALQGTSSWQSAKRPSAPWWSARRESDDPLHLPPMNCDGDGRPRTKNGPALAGHGAEAVRDAITRAITPRPFNNCRRSLTWDQGAEMALDPPSSGSRLAWRSTSWDPDSPAVCGTEREHDGAAACQYFPKGTDLSVHSAEDLAAVAIASQQQAAKDPGLENTGRGSGPIPLNNSHRPRCDGPLEFD